MRKQYTRMTVDCDAFELNEAIAGNCTSVFFPDVAEMLCDDCFQRHWKVFLHSDSYRRDYGATVWSADAIAVNTGVTSGSCYNAGLRSGEIVRTAAYYGDDHALERNGEAYFEPFPDGTAGHEVPNYYLGDIDDGTGAIDGSTIVYGAAS